MHILITGAAGMIGRKLTERLLKDGKIGKREITKLTLHDIVAPSAKPNSHTSIRPIVGDLSDKSLIDRLISENLRTIPGVTRTHTTIVMSSVKEGTHIKPMVEAGKPSKKRR